MKIGDTFTYLDCVVIIHPVRVVILHAGVL